MTCNSVAVESDDVTANVLLRLLVCAVDELLNIHEPEMYSHIITSTQRAQTRATDVTVM